jgi:diguanylate cyclase (GGDEF)-like protein
MITINTYYEDFKGLLEFVRNNIKILGSSDNSAVLVQVFNGQCDQDFLTKLLAELTELLPQAQIFGTTSSGEIMNGEVSGLKTVLSFSIFKQTIIRAGFFPKGALNDFELGRKIGSALGGSNGKLLILFSTGGAVHSNTVLKGVESLCPGLPVTGGNAGFNSYGCFVFCQNQITSCGVVGVVLEGKNLQINCYSNLGWQPIGKEMTITKVAGVHVFTIDNLPADQIYQKYLGLDASNFSSATEYPLLVERHGSLIARTPCFLHKDGSITFEEEFAEGEKVRFSFGDFGLIFEGIDSLCRDIRQSPAESIFVYSCESRRGFLQDLSKMETEPLQKIANTSGFFTYGEFNYKNNTNQVLNATMTVTVLAETGAKIFEYGTKEAGKNCDGGYDLSKDKLVARRTGVLKTLTHLINTVAAELVAANEQLRYIGLHDPLSGLYNRAFFDQEMQRLKTDDCSVGIVICDMDSLKVINDTLGHSFGDKMICMAAKVITEACPKDAIVSRIGGDEFAIFIFNPSLSLLKNISKRIMTLAAKYRRVQSERCLYLSVGFALRESGGEKNIDDLFKIADANMYNHKKRNRHHIRKKILAKIVSGRG